VTSNQIKTNLLDTTKTLKAIKTLCEQKRTAAKLALFIRLFIKYGYFWLFRAISGMPKIIVTCFEWVF
jgi:hypothetical protein